MTKLAENGGVDPFDEKGVRRLEESALIDLATTTTTTGGGGGGGVIIPPRAPKSTSLPSLLTMMKSEFDAVLLELYDTRHALEETRRELSLALYQNDAAIRVVARLASERDESRSLLERYMNDPSSSTTTLQQQQGGSTQKRAREENDNEEVENDMPAPKKAAKVVVTAEGEVEEEGTVADLSKIPSSELDVMSSTWKTLTTERRSIAKLKRTPEEIAKNEATLSALGGEGGGGDGESKKVNLGKASAKAGILCMTTLRSDTSTTEFLITGGHDKNATVYDIAEGKIVATLTGASGDIVTVHHGKLLVAASADDDGGGGTASSMHVVTGSADGHVRLYELLFLPQDGKKDTITSTLVGTAKLDMGVPIDVVLHPSSTNGEARILVASSNGRLELFKWSSSGGDSTNSKDGEDLKLLTRLESGGDDIKYTSGCMHPDGFIYIAGTHDGSLIVWDLKTQAVAGTLKVSSHRGHIVEWRLWVLFTASCSSDHALITLIATSHSLSCLQSSQGHDGLSIDCIAISENGYHVATSSSANTNSPIHIWDLRKLKLSATIIPTDDVGTVLSLAFDPTASYLAYAGEMCTKICVAKEWDRVVCTLTPSKKGAAKKGKAAAAAGSGAVVWGGQGFGLKEGEGGNVWLAVGCDGERPVRFWGVE